MREGQQRLQQDMQARQEEIREENKLARALAGWDEEQTAGLTDFRRRKVRWFF